MVHNVFIIIAYILIVFTLEMIWDDGSIKNNLISFFTIITSPLTIIYVAYNITQKYEKEKRQEDKRHQEEERKRQEYNKYIDQLFTLHYQSIDNKKYFGKSMSKIAINTIKNLNEIDKEDTFYIKKVINSLLILANQRSPLSNGDFPIIHLDDLYNYDLSYCNLRSCNLTKAKLNSKNLIKIDLSHSELIEADLRESNLFGANLQGAKLRNAKLISADLSIADLIGADLIGADLSDADLSGADLSDANLSGANLSGADLSGANLSRTTLKKTNFDTCNIDQAIFSEARHLEREQILKAVNIKNARFDKEFGSVLEEI